jgi:hypothetical protein
MNSFKNNSSINNINKQQDLLKVLATSKKGIRNAILSNADKKLVIAILDSVFNLLNGSLNLSKPDLAKLAKYKHVFRRLIEKAPLAEKKKILVQHGGFLQFLVPAIVTGISSIVSSLISSNSSNNSNNENNK